MNKKFEILDHTADAKFKAYGKNLEESFTNAAYAMYKILLKDEVIKPKLKYDFEKESRSLEALLFDFLDELLFLMDTESIVLSEVISVKIRTVKPNLIKLECSAMFDRAIDYDIGGNIKSVTYSEIKVEKKKDGFELQVVVDI